MWEGRGGAVVTELNGVLHFLGADLFCRINERVGRRGRSSMTEDKAWSRARAEIVRKWPFG